MANGGGALGAPVKVADDGVGPGATRPRKGRAGEPVSTTAQGCAGKRVGGFVYVHRDALTAAPEHVGTAVARIAESSPLPDWNVAKVGEGKASAGRISLLLYEDFDAAAFPALLRAARLNAESGTFEVTDYSARANPPILHRKETLLAPDDPRIPAFRAVTAKAEEAGLFADTKRIGTRQRWDELLAGAGLRTDGPRLVAVGEKAVQVARGKTAMSRSGLSTPMSAMLRLGMVGDEDEVFDYGCGRGDDLVILQSNGFRAFGWDPVHRPDGERRQADVVNLGFVINVIEDPYERIETLKAAWSYARRALAVSVMLVGKSDVSGQTGHGDGYLTRKGTFQKYFTQDELEDFVSSATGERAASLSTGMVAVFRDKDLEQEVMFRRRSRASYLSRSIEVPYRERPAREVAPALREKIADELAAIWNRALELGRMPAVSEVDRFTASGLAEKNVSLRRALACAGEVFDPARMKEAADGRREDLVAHFALSLFPGSPRYSSLPESLQRNVKAFFGSHARLMEEARRQLHALSEDGAFDAACRSAAEAGLGSLEDGVLRVSTKDYGRMPVRLRIVLGCADVVHGGFLECDFARIGPDRGVLKGYRCQKADGPLPLVEEEVHVDLGRARSWVRWPSGKVLYLKSRFMAAEDPARPRQVKADRRLVVAGVVDAEGNGPDAAELASILGRQGRTKT